jgi:hypothetical protein
MMKIAVIAKNESEKMADKYIPAWKKKIMMFTKGKRKKPLLSFGYQIDMLPLPLLEGDIVRAVLIMRKRSKQLEAKEIRIMKPEQGQIEVNVVIEQREVPYEQSI